MNVNKTNLQGVLLIKPDVFEDFRGQYIELYNEALFAENGIDAKFVQDDISVSSRHVLRGIHGDRETWKLISCLHGMFYFVVVNCNESSKDFGRWQGFTLSEKNRQQVLVPPLFGNAHLVMSDEAVFHYKQTTYYDPSKQFTFKWNDPKFNIWWPIRNPILSQRDEYGRFNP